MLTKVENFGAISINSRIVCTYPDSKTGEAKARDGRVDAIVSDGEHAVLTVETAEGWKRFDTRKAEGLRVIE